MAKNQIINAINNVANNRLNGKYNLTQYREGGSRHEEKKAAMQHKEVCEQVVKFVETHKDIPMYFILSVGISKGAYKMSEFEKGYKVFNAEKVELVHKMGMAYNAYNEQYKKKMSDVSIRLIMRYYEKVSHDFNQFLVDLNNSKVLGKMCGSRDMKYSDLCKNLNIPINDKEKSPIKNNGRNINENMDANNNKDNQELEDNNVKNNDIFTFSEQKNKNNQEFNNNIRMDEIDNKNDNNHNYFKQKQQQEINDQPNEMIDNNVPLTYVYRRKSEEEEIEEQKKEIIKNIISEIFQDTTKLYFLKKELGEDIGEKLLSGNITEKELYKVVKELKKIQENNLRKKKLFPKKKFNQPSDKILLKQKLSNKRYNFREFPRGWSSTKDYFINNGTPLIKDKRYKK